MKNYLHHWYRHIQRSHWHTSKKLADLRDLDRQTPNQSSRPHRHTFLSLSRFTFVAIGDNQQSVNHSAVSLEDSDGD